MSANSLALALTDNNNDIKSILKMLNIFSEGEQRFNANAALLKYGKHFEHIDRYPAGLRKGPSGQCFKNCTSALMQFVGAVNSPFLYAEGYALDAEFGIPYEHAWLVDTAGRAIDLTWRETDGAVYYGITFKLDALLAAMRFTEVYGLLFNPRLQARLFSEPTAFAKMLSRPGLPGLPRCAIT